MKIQINDVEKKKSSKPRRNIKKSTFLKKVELQTQVTPIPTPVIQNISNIEKTMSNNDPEYSSDKFEESNSAILESKIEEKVIDIKPVMEVIPSQQTSQLSSKPITLERLSATCTNVKNHDENSSEDYSSSCFKDYYAIIMTYAPKLLAQIQDIGVRNQF